MFSSASFKLGALTALMAIQTLALPTAALSERGNPVKRLDKITCRESNGSPTALCAKDATSTVRDPVMADCLKLAERQFHFGDGYVEVIRLNGWVAAEGKCKLSIDNLNDAASAGGLVDVEVDPKLLGPWIKEQSQACFNKPESNYAHCTMAEPMLRFKLWSGDE